ncbi:hypothetical protein NUSPORA_02267 [Nucleospora cyclopteri]
MSVNDEKTQRFLTFLLNKPFNKKCADCGKMNPSWASVTLGLFLCYECAGMHRSLGAEKSLIKAVSINEWETEELRRMFIGGNINASRFDKKSNFIEKYRNCGKFIQMLDQKAAKNREEFPGETFMETAGKKEAFKSIGIIKKKEVEKFSTSFVVDEKVLSTKEEKPIKTAHKKAPKEKIKEQPILSDSVALKNSVANKNEIKKTISSNRSPFMFSPDEIDEENE